VKSRSRRQNWGYLNVSITFRGCCEFNVVSGCIVSVCVYMCVCVCLLLLVVVVVVVLVVVTRVVHDSLYVRIKSLTIYCHVYTSRINDL